MLENQTVLIKRIVKILSEKDRSLTKKKVKQILFAEQQKILERIIGVGKLPKDIAPNNALLENLLTCFVCIFSKTPLFICGKPGSSKSIALHLLRSAFAGQTSQKESILFFNQFPKLFLFEIQGSGLTTWENVLSVLRKCYDSALSSEELGFVFFDEMGLVKDSRVFPGIKHVLKNPGKFFDRSNADPLADQDQEAARSLSFVGVSNDMMSAWHLSPLVFLARTDPSEEDLIITAKQILFMNTDNSFSKDSKNVLEKLSQALGKAYLKFKKIMEVELLFLEN